MGPQYLNKIILILVNSNNNKQNQPNHHAVAAVWCMCSVPCQRWVELSCLLAHWARVSRFLSLWSSMCTLVKELRSRNIHRPWQRLKPVGRHTEISVYFEI